MIAIRTFMQNTSVGIGLLFFLGCQSQPTSSFEVPTFTKPSENPIIRADSTLTFLCPVQNKLVKWQKADVFNPAAIAKDDKIYLLYRAEDNPAASIGGRTSRIGLAYSEDGIHFIKRPTPILFPDTTEFMQYDYPGGCEDPRIVETKDGMYVLTYTSWNRKTARLTIAFSKDLIYWEKKGLAFQKAYDGKFFYQWSKSGAIVTEMYNGKPIAAKIDGKYWMYWGDSFINLAWSDNLNDWNPLLDEKGELKVIAGPRKNKFDSFLAESGPPALITKEGVVLFYNGKNAEDENASPDLPIGTYSVGKLVFDLNDLEKIIYRSDICLLRPTLPFEIIGQYKLGTIFAEGLVYFDSKWFLYYGTADSFVGVATTERL